MENITEHEKRKREAEDRALLIRLCDKYHYSHMMTRSSATGPVEIYYYCDTPIRELERIIGNHFARTEVRRATAEDLKEYIDRWTLFGADADVVETFCGMMGVDYSSYKSDFDAYDAATARYNAAERVE